MASTVQYLSFLIQTQRHAKNAVYPFVSFLELVHFSFCLLVRELLIQVSMRPQLTSSEDE